jgi:hypothetical protein
MTIQIQKLAIQAKVVQRLESAADASAPEESQVARGQPSSSVREGEGGPDLEALFSECTRRVLAELQRRQGR